MATHRTKSGAAGRHKAARPTQRRYAGKGGAESKRSDNQETMPGGKDDANARSARGEPAPRIKPGVGERDSSSMSESRERSPTRGSRWERADDETLITGADQPDGGAAPLADSDEAPEGSER
jgi:hypothetical protein